MDYQTKAPARTDNRRRAEFKFPYPDDIVNFIHRKFAAENIATVYETLSAWNIVDVRTVRCVLLLTDGRSSMLEHYCRHAGEDLLKVINWAECIDQVAAAPMRVRNLDRPFKDGDVAPRQPLAFAASLD